MNWRVFPESSRLNWSASQQRTVKSLLAVLLLTKPGHLVFVISHCYIPRVSNTVGDIFMFFCISGGETPSIYC